MATKKFFEKRTPSEIQSLSISKVYTQRNLVDRIWDLSDGEAIELRSPLIPSSFMKGVQNQARASRKDYKHGPLIHISQPQTQQQAYDFPYTPLTARMNAFEALREMKEEEINFIGITWQPVQSKDRRWRVLPFDVSIEGTKLYNYAVNRAGGIEVDATYTNAEVVRREGARILCKVPSRTKGRERYNITLVNVPIVQSKEKNAIIWGLKSQFEDGKEPERSTFLHNLRYEFADSNKGSDIFVFGPHEYGAYLAVIKKYWKGLENTVPLEMNPFMLPSKNWASYGDKLDNNILIYDPTLSIKDKLRHLHLDEKCILLARSIVVKGAYETAFWDPQRDGNIKDYWK